MSQPTPTYTAQAIADAVSVACRSGERAASDLTGIPVLSVRRWCKDWGVPANPPSPSDATVGAAVRGLMREFLPPDTGA